jgi:hypothetical protein
MSSAFTFFLTDGMQKGGGGQYYSRQVCQTISEGHFNGQGSFKIKGSLQIDDGHLKVNRSMTVISRPMVIAMVISRSKGHFKSMKVVWRSMVIAMVTSKVKGHFKVKGSLQINEGQLKVKGNFKVKGSLQINEGHFKVKGHCTGHFKGQGSLKVKGSFQINEGHLKVNGRLKVNGHCNGHFKGQGSFQGQRVTSDQWRSSEGQQINEGHSDQWRSFQGQG